MKITKFNAVLILIFLGFVSCKQVDKESSVEASETNVALFYNGDIITMEGDSVEYAEAIVQENGKIVFVGSEDEAREKYGDMAVERDLQGQTLMPGFIDPHSHVVMQALKYSVVNLDPHPIGDIKTIADIQRKLSQRIEETNPDSGKWVYGWGYDDTGLEEQRHPTRADLDSVSTDHPILLIHISSHLMAANSKALELAGITADTPDPEGGRIQRMPGSDEPNGVLEETAMAIVFNALSQESPPTSEQAIEMLNVGLGKYAEAGITTAQEGAATPGVLKLLNIAYKAGEMPIDIVSYPLYKTLKDSLINQIGKSWNTFGRYRMGGIKLVVDGSIQGYTAYLSEPYYMQPGSGEQVEEAHCNSDAGMKMLMGIADSLLSTKQSEEDPAEGYRGYAGMTDEDVIKYIRIADENGFPFLAHTNGDAATDMLIDAIREVRGDQPRPDLRSVIIHAQTMREDQLDFAAEHGLVPSFFPIHVQFWGDRHRDIFLGPERAARIDPARSALDRQMKFTLHHDAPVAGINMFNILDAAVTRRTSSGKVLGAEQAITTYQALAAITRDAAWQYFEEDRKGTLTEKKLADFVILENNPLKQPVPDLRNNSVIETIKEGKTVYLKEDTSKPIGKK